MARRRHSQWQELYLAVLLETDRARLAEQIAALEEELLVRLCVLTPSADHELEVQAIQLAMSSVAVLKRVKLAKSSRLVEMIPTRNGNVNTEKLLHLPQGPSLKAG